MTVEALALLIFCGSAAAGQSWQERLSLAERFSEAGKHEDAAAAAHGVRMGIPDNDLQIGPILLRLGRIYDAAEAAGALPEMERRSPEIKTDDYQVWLALGEYLRAEGILLEAETALKKALARNPDDPAAQYSLARLYGEMDRFDEEAQLLSGLIKKGSQSRLIYVQLANAYSRLGRFAEAAETLARAKKLAVDTAENYIDVGYFLADSSDTARAEEAFKSAIDVDTASPYGYHHMGWFLNITKRLPESEKSLRRAWEKIKANPNTSASDVSHTAGWLAAVLEQRGQYAEAEALYLEVLDKIQGSDRPRRRLLEALGRLYLAQGKYERAADIFQLLAGMCEKGAPCTDKVRGGVLVSLGEAELKQGHRAAAEGLAERAEAVCHEASISRGCITVLKNLADLYLRLGDASKRESIYDRLVPLRSKRPFDAELARVESKLAGVRAEQGRIAEAEELSRRAAGILTRNRAWTEAAAEFDELARFCEKDGGSGKRAADEAREQAKSLRAQR